MLIENLNKTTCPIAQAALVSKFRADARRRIEKMATVHELMLYAERLYRTSKQHSAANSLQREAELATQRAVDISSHPEHVAQQVIQDGTDYFVAQGKRPPKGRLTQMYNRYGSWALVHKRLVEKGFGGANFLWLKSQNKIELTSEWFIARHASHLVSAEMLAALEALLAADSPLCAKAA